MAKRIIIAVSLSAGILSLLFLMDAESYNGTFKYFVLAMALAGCSYIAWGISLIFVAMFFLRRFYSSLLALSITVFTIFDFIISFFVQKEALGEFLTNQFVQFQIITVLIMLVLFMLHRARMSNHEG